MRTSVVLRDGLWAAPARATRTLVVDISDLQVSDDPETAFITYALGSCIAVALYDPVRRAGGMIHYMLPLSRTSPEKARTKPAMFADSGVPLLFERMYGLGCRKRDLVVKVAGGGRLYDDNDTFDIGRRNVTVLRRLFREDDIVIAAEDVGGSASRTVRLELATGRVTVRSQGVEVEL